MCPPVQIQVRGFHLLRVVYEETELLKALLIRYLQETIYVAWDNAVAHQDNDVDAVLRVAAERLIWL